MINNYYNYSNYQTYRPSFIDSLLKWEFSLTFLWEFFLQEWYYRVYEKYNQELHNEVKNEIYKFWHDYMIRNINYVLFFQYLYRKDKNVSLHTVSAFFLTFKFINLFYLAINTRYSISSFSLFITVLQTSFIFRFFIINQYFVFSLFL